MGFHTEWAGGDFAEFKTADGELSLFMYSRKVFVHAIGESYVPPKGINQTFGIRNFYVADPEMAGMYILKTDSREEAEDICSREPLVTGGYATYKLVELQVANRENNYLL